MHHPMEYRFSLYVSSISSAIIMVRFRENRKRSKQIKKKYSAYWETLDARILYNACNANLHLLNKCALNEVVSLKLHNFVVAIIYIPSSLWNYILDSNFLQILLIVSILINKNPLEFSFFTAEKIHLLTQTSM